MRTHIDKKRREEIFESFRVGPNSALYNEDGSVFSDPKAEFRKKRNKWLKICIPICSLFIILAAIIYLPQFFVTENRANELVFSTDKNQYNIFQKYIKENGAADFDGDGIKNHQEMANKTNPFARDSDYDGVDDLRDLSPLKKDDTLYTTLLASGGDIKEPYQINGVILWPKTKSSWALGAVIPVDNGYQFTGFEGWAKFPEGKYAYKYVDGKHSLLKYKKNANAWYIDGDYIVTLADEKPENTYLISTFGHSIYMRNGLGSFLAAMLPDRGWITGEAMWLDDTFVDTRTNVYSKHQKVNLENLPDNRFGSYTESLDDLADVYNFIDDGKCVLATIMSQKHGEAIVEIYGYTADGNLIVADPQIKSISGVIEIDICCSRALDENGKITAVGWFEFFGCGFSSADGDLIGFYSVIGGESQE